MKGKLINITWAWDKGKTWDLMRSPGIEPMTSQTPRTPGTHVAFPFQKTDSKGLSNEQLCKLSKVYLMLLFHWCYSRKCLVFNRLGVAMLTMYFIVLCAVIVWPEISISSLQKTISCGQWCTIFISHMNLFSIYIPRFMHCCSCILKMS